ncbi:DUF4265 domain-containing protein [Streptomyces griseoluteus]|uniref:DUF4265 domain-containing protein n=1 Tax=Streptomyces griseoluteus TaxID=29306 RepID=UPI00368BEB79
MTQSWSPSTTTWLQEVDEGGAYEVSCIPFYAYGLALGDVVGTSDSHDVDRVIRKSGHRVVRVLFTESRPSVDSRSALRAAVESADLLSEWNGDRMVAIDFPHGSPSQPILDSIQGEVEGGTAFWEWSDSMEFRPA